MMILRGNLIGGTDKGFRPTRTKQRFFGFISIIVLYCILNLVSCTVSRHPYYERSLNLKSMPGYYEIKYGERALNSAVLKQIDEILPYFCNGDFIYFCVDTLQESQNPFSRSIDICLEKKLFNHFLLIFTKPQTDSVVGYVRQLKPLAVELIMISDCELKKILESGKYDIYLFHNNELIIKDRYTFIDFCE